MDWFGSEGIPFFLLRFQTKNNEIILEKISSSLLSHKSLGWRLCWHQLGEFLQCFLKRITASQHEQQLHYLLFDLHNVELPQLLPGYPFGWHWVWPWKWFVCLGTSDIPMGHTPGFLPRANNRHTSKGAKMECHRLHAQSVRKESKAMAEVIRRLFESATESLPGASIHTW